MRIRRREISVDMDKKILTGMIVSDNYCLDISRIINLDYFKTSYSKIIGKWVLRYHKRYQKAPTSHIKDIFESEESFLKEEEADLIKKFLVELSKQYEEEQNIENAINVPYLFDETLAYFKERSLHLHHEKVKALLEIGKIEEAESVVRDFKKVAKSTSEWVDPFSKEAIEKTFENKDIDNLFRFPGDLGDMIGYFKKRWLISFMAPIKRGKSWWLLQTAYIALCAGYRVVFISLEMNENEVMERFYKLISALGDEEDEVLFPCFDCLLNQNDTCVKFERTGKGKLLRDDGSLPEIEDCPSHKPCTYCRDNNMDGFIVSSWVSYHKIKSLTKQKAKTYINGMKGMFGNNLRVLTMPINTTTSEDIKSELDNLEYTENFVPTVIIIDYADILGAEQSNLSGRERINETWLMLKNLAQTKHALVVTATQSNRKSLYKKFVTQDEVSEDLRKLAHVDIMMALNQTETEEELGVMRVGITVHRHKKSIEKQNVLVLTQTDVGQPMLDSERIKPKTNNKKRFMKNKYPKKPEKGGEN